MVVVIESNIISGRNPPLYCTVHLDLISMQVHTTSPTPFSLDCVGGRIMLHDAQLITSSDGDFQCVP